MSLLIVIRGSAGLAQRLSFDEPGDRPCGCEVHSSGDALELQPDHGTRIRHFVLFDFADLARSDAGSIPASALPDNEGPYL